MRYKSKTFVNDLKYANLNQPSDGGSGGGSENIAPPMPSPSPTIFPVANPTILPYYPYAYGYPYLYEDVSPYRTSQPTTQVVNNNKNILYFGVVIIGVALLLRAIK